VHELLGGYLSSVHWLERLLGVRGRLLLRVDGLVVVRSVSMCCGAVLGRWSGRVLLVFGWFFPDINGAIELLGLRRWKVSDGGGGNGVRRLRCWALQLNRRTSFGVFRFVCFGLLLCRCRLVVHIMWRRDLPDCDRINGLHRVPSGKLTDRVSFRLGFVCDERVWCVRCH